jgi:hypothetical protein
MYTLKGLPNNSTPVYWLSYFWAGLNIYTGRMIILLLGILSIDAKILIFSKKDYGCGIVKVVVIM